MINEVSGLAGLSLPHIVSAVISSLALVASSQVTPADEGEGVGGEGELVVVGGVASGAGGQGRKQRDH